MQVILKRAETGLIAVPLLFMLIDWICYHGRTVDIHIHDTMFVAAMWHIHMGLLLLMIFYFLLHLFLRTRKWRNSRLCNIHAAGTVICLLIICMVLILPGEGPREGFSAEDLELTRTEKLATGGMMMVALAFVLLQLLFLVYFTGGLIANVFPVKQV